MAPARGTSAQFTETRWTVILAAQAGGAGAEEAWSQLCQKNYFPVYAFIRRQGTAPHDAQDLTQGFFAHVLRQDWLANVDRSKGLFRTFVLRCLKNFLSNEREKLGAAKRKSEQPPVALDATEAEERYKLEPLDGADPAVLFDRQWASCLIGRVLAKLQAEYAARNAGHLFEALLPSLVGESERGDWGAVAAHLGKSVEAAKTAGSRLRAEFRELLRREIAETVDSPQEVEGEIQALFQIFER